MELRYKKSAAKEMARLSKAQPMVAREIRHRLEDIALDPFATASDVKKLRNHDDLYRLRYREWRAIYQLESDLVLMTVIRVRHRSEAY